MVVPTSFAVSNKLYCLNSPRAFYILVKLNKHLPTGQWKLSV
ncbi:hypothetical protein LEP1GSC087_2433 [Leptospira interrogans serovar Bataviae str. L1111]|nr:hypothetical protein LEP1GSC087_2433 [Leptospira interrogans serovar Bataviae str. L1111]